MSKVKDEVLKHFVKCEGGDKFLCLYCRKEYVSEIANLKRHLERLHSTKFELKRERSNIPDFFSEMKRIKIEKEEPTPPLQPSVDQSANSGIQHKFFVSMKKHLDQMLVRMLVTDLEVFDFVERKGFVEILKEMYKGEEMPTANELEKQFSNLYQSSKEILHTKLSEVDFVSISADLWSLSNTGRYLTCACHFKFGDQLCAAVLETKQIDDGSVRVIGEILKQLFVDWNIPKNKIICVVSDDMTNISQAVTTLGIRHVPSFAHSLTLVASDCLKFRVVNHLAKKVNDIATFFLSYPKSKYARKDIEEMERNLNSIKLASESWINDYHRMKCILNVNETLTELCVFLPNAPSSLSSEELDKLHDCIFCLDLLYKACKEISRDAYAGQSLIIPIIYVIHKELSEMEKKKMKSSDGTDLLKRMKSSVKKRLSIYETNSIIIKSTLLDPRWKKSVLTKQITEKESKKLIYDEVLPVAGEPNDSTDSDNIINFASDNSIDDSIFRQLDRTHQTSTAISIGKTNLNQYLQEPNILRNEDPLEYWKNNKSRFPDLYTEAYKSFIVPANCVSSEWISPDEGTFLRNQRKMIKPEYIDKYIFLRQNKWLESIDSV